jgi:hypothetical protein
MRVASHGGKRFCRFPRLVLESLESRLTPAVLADYAPVEILVSFRADTTPAQIQCARARVGASVAETLRHGAVAAGAAGTIERLTLPEGMSVAQAIATLQANPHVSAVEPNFLARPAAVADDPLYADGSQWGLYGADLSVATGPAGTTNPYGCNAEAAWAAGATGSSQVYVGVIDQGIQVSHPDLAANVWVNPYDPVDGIDNDGNGYIDDVNGWDFYSNDNSVDDGGEWHGTPVAGIAGAAGGNGQGVSGVAQQVGLISTKFMGASGSISGVISSLEYLTDLKLRHGINVVAVNNSWNAGSYYSQLLHESILRAARANILFVAAAGNNGFDTDTNLSYPANYTTLTGTLNEPAASYEAVLTVAALDSAGNLAGFSNRGAATVDIGAPGVGIVSTTAGGGYGGGSGTSFSTPFVSGAVAVYAAAHPDASAAQTRSALLAGACPTPSLDGLTVTGRRLDLGSAIRFAPSGLVAIGAARVLEGHSGSRLLHFPVTLSNPVTDAVTIDFATSDLLATAGVDYLASTGTLTFLPGQTSQMVSISVLGDTAVEADETLRLTLSNPRGARLNVDSATGVIIDDEVPRVFISDLQVPEGNRGKTTRTLTVTLSEPAINAVSIAFNTMDGTAFAGTDYLSTSGTLRFRKGQSSATLSVTTLGDTAIEKDECLHVVLTVVSGSARIFDGLGTIRLMNDDFGGGVSGLVQTVLVQASAVDTALALVAVPVPEPVETATLSFVPTPRVAAAGRPEEVPFPLGAPVATVSSKLPPPSRQVADRLFSIDLDLNPLAVV